MNKNLITVALATVAIVPMAQAVNIDFQGTISGKSKNVEIYHNGWMTVSAGAMNILVDGVGPIEAYCVDLDHFITNGMSWDVNVLELGSHPEGAVNVALAKNVLVSNYFSVSTNNQGAALQLAVWDALYDGGDGLTTGGFQARNMSAGLISAYNTVFATQNSPLNPVSNYTFNYYEATSHGPNNDKYQDLVSLEPVPEPATMAIFGLGALAAMRKRKKA